MKSALAITLLMGSINAYGETIIRQNIPGMNVPDLTARSVIVDDDGQIYRSVPGMPNVRDVSEPAYFLQGREIIPEAIPGLKARDFAEPSLSIEE